MKFFDEGIEPPSKKQGEVSSSPFNPPRIKGLIAAP
jgi:hypothetical protein